MWLVDITQDDKTRYRKVQPNWQRTATAVEFTEENSDGDRLALRADMKATLVDEGLFEDEAEAMLNTWEASYFHTPGLRLFFTVPQSWTDKVLPLSISGYDMEATRVMIGRVELVSERQKELLGRIAAGPVSTKQWFNSAWWPDFDPTVDAERRKKLIAGEIQLSDFVKTIPNDYQAYVDLGRFRDALVIHEIGKHQNDNLKQFARNYGLPLQ